MKPVIKAYSPCLHERINKIRKRLECWWEHGDQKNPCLILSTRHASKDSIPETDDLTKFWTDVDFIINRQLQIIDNTNYYGQAIPFHYVDHGSAAMACALGAEPEYVNKDTIWASPQLSSISQILNVTLNEQNKSFKTILSITKESIKKSPNKFMIAPYALGGISDTISGLYGTQQFLMDLLCCPNEVKQAMEHIKRIWIKAFEDITKLIACDGNDGSMGWAGIWAPGSSFPVQEDVSYMLSSKMFYEFCLPHLIDIFDVMQYPLYHLDGIGAIGHLEHLLNIKKLKAIQWIPGAGHEELSQWYDLIKHIIEKGKSVQVFAKPNEIGDLVKNVGAKGLLISCECTTDSQAQELIERYGD
jgi:hypothetical protein